MHGHNIGVPFLFLSLLKYILSHPCNPLPKQELKVSINSPSQVQASRNIFTGAAATFTHTAPSICDKLVAVHDTCIDTALKTAGVLAWPRDPKTIFFGCTINEEKQLKTIPSCHHGIQAKCCKVSVPLVRG